LLLRHRNAVAPDKLSVRLARNRREVVQAQALRYRVFHQEMGAASSLKHKLLRRDVDRFDRVSDHLLVIAPRWRPLVPHISGAVVGAYRLIQSDVAKRRGFYSADEFDLSSIQQRFERCLELGRSCVDPDYRSRAVIDRLWRAIAAYVVQHDIDVLFGCASFPGADPDAHAACLSYLHHHHGAPLSCRPRALDDRYVDMALLAKDQIEPKKAWAALPPLLKGYLRLGAVIGDGAVIDRNFNTTDVCVVLPTKEIKVRYIRRYGQKVDDASAV
jgi:putative hemolysin